MQATVRVTPGYCGGEEAFGQLWVAMACAYPKGREYNAKEDGASTRRALENWPTPIVFTDFQYGVDCYAGKRLADTGAVDNPVADVFRTNFPRHYHRPGHPAWDQTAVLIAVRGVTPYFNLMRGTYRMVDDSGLSEWVPAPDSPHGRVTEKLPKAEVGQIIDELMCRAPEHAAK